MRVIAAVCLLGLALAGTAAAESGLVTDVSHPSVQVSYRYQGETLLVFGSLADPGGHVVVEVRGPERPRTIQRKGRVLGLLWMNVEDLTIEGMPGYYALLSDVPVERLLGSGERARLGMGREALFRAADYHGETASAGRRDYFDGLIRHMAGQGLFQERPEAVTIRRDRLFRAELRMPSRAPVGNYRVVVRQMKDGAVVHRDVRTLQVAKTGMEKWLYDLAYRHPAWYGVAAVAVALLTGWLVGVITRGEVEH